MKGLFGDLYYLGHFLAAEGLGRQPFSWLRKSGIDGLARLAYGLSREKRRRIERNLEIAFGPGQPPSERRRLTLACFREFWREMVDCVPDAGAGPVPASVPVRGIEHARRALEDGRGAILWESNGFGRRFYGKQVLHANGLRVYQTHGETHLGAMEILPGPGTPVRRFLRGCYDRREKTCVEDILDVPLSATVSSGRSYLKQLRRNRLLCMAGDGQIARQLHDVRLLGRTVQLAPGAVKLARLSGAPLLPFFWTPGRDGVAVVEIDPPIVPEGEGDAAVVACLQQFADALDRRVRRWPDAYRNWHLLGDRLEGETALRATQEDEP